MDVDSELGLDLMDEDSSPPNEFDLAGRSVAFSGRFEAMNRADLTQLVRDRGGVPVAFADEAQLLIVGMKDFPFDDLDSQLTEVQLEAVAAGKLQVLSEVRLWQLLGMAPAESGVRRLYTAAMLANLLGLPVSTIRRWHRRGLIEPAQMVHKLAYFDFQEVASARQIAKWIQSGASPAAIEAKLSRIAQLFPDVQRPLSQLSVIIEGKNVLLRQGEGLVEPGGQRRIDFAALESEAADSTASVVNKVSPDPKSVDELATPEQHRQLAAELEDEGRIAEAIQVYRSMLFAFGPSAEVSFAIAELLYLSGDVSGARERYFMAIELDDSLVEARASLGCLLLETREYDLAISTLQGALKLHPEYADVHFHLARALEDCGRVTESARHWEQFLSLAPDSPWAAEAQQRLAAAFPQS